MKEGQDKKRQRAKEKKEEGSNGAGKKEIR